MSDERKDIVSDNEQSQSSSYRSIFKATSLFGGVQMYQILIGVVKSKFVAVLLGPAGMGIMGLYLSTVELVKSISSFGLEQSAVRDISEANGTGDTLRIGYTTSIIRRLVWFTGVLGLFLTLFLSPLLSKFTFGNGDYTWGFAILSITLLIDQLCVGQKVLIQGIRRLKDLAKASAIGATIGLLVSVPMYYRFGLKGIVPTMVLTSISAMLISWYYSTKIAVDKVAVTFREALEGGRSMIKMGISLSVSGIFVTTCAYILRWFIREQGGVEEVGLFTAGYVIMTTYVGMVFKAMGTDYYPRLAAVNKDNNKCKEIINQQAEVAVLILAPLVILCIMLMPRIVKIIYSTDFMASTNYVLWAILGTLFKAASWSIAFIFLAKAEAKFFIINELFGNLISLILHFLGYNYFGLTGLGVAFLLTNLYYLFQVYIIAHKRYQFRFSNNLVSLFTILLLLVLISFVIAYTWHSPLSYIALSCAFITSTIYSVKELNKRMSIFRIFRYKLL